MRTTVAVTHRGGLRGATEAVITPIGRGPGPSRLRSATGARLVQAQAAERGAGISPTRYRVALT